MTRKTIASLETEITVLETAIEEYKRQVSDLTYEREVAREWAKDKTQMTDRLLNIIDSCAKEGNLRIDASRQQR
jgi:cell division protein FtsB